MDPSENTNPNGENDQEAGRDVDVALPDAGEAKPEDEQAEKRSGDSSAAFAASVGANLGRTTRLLGKGSEVLWRGTGGAIVKAARNVGASVKRLEERKKQRSTGRGLRERAEELRRQMDDALRDIGREAFKGSKPSSTSLEVGEGMQELLSKARDIQNELDEVEQAGQDTELSAAEEAAKVADFLIEAEGEPVVGESEAGEQGAAKRAEPKKKGKSRAKAQTESERTSARAEAKEPAEGEAEAKEPAEGEEEEASDAAEDEE